MVHTERGNDSPLAGLSKPPAERGSNLAWLLLTFRKEGTRLPPAVVLRIGIDAAHRLEAARVLALGRGTKGGGVHGALSSVNAPGYRAREVTFPLERPSAVADLPPAVDAVLLRALERAPEARFADAGEFGAAMLAGVMTPKREREREEEINAVLERLADTSGQLEALIAEREKHPLQLVGPPPTEEELRALDDLGEPPDRILDIQSAFDDQAPLPRELRSKDALTLFTRLVALGFERLGDKCETDVLSGQVTPAVVFSAAAAPEPRPGRAARPARCLRRPRCSRATGSSRAYARKIKGQQA